MIDSGRPRIGLRSHPRGTRILALALVVLVGLTALAWRLFEVQIVEGPQLAALGAAYTTRQLVVEPDRGVIYDRHGVPLAVNRPAFAVYAEPSQLSSDAATRQWELKQVAAFAKEKLATVMSTLARPGAYWTSDLVAPVDQGAAQSLQELLPQLPGVSLESTPQRQYLQANLFSHIIGYTGRIDAQQYQQLKSKGYQPSDSIGEVGLEAGLESWLRGKDGSELVQYNALGAPDRTLSSTPATSGDSVYLTIDAGFQAATDNFLRQEIAKDHKTAGAAVVVDTQNGQILAMASEPTFNPNLFAQGISSQAYQQLVTDPSRPLLDRALDGQYAPGSTFKMITASAALQGGFISPSTAMDCPPYITYDGWVYRNWASYDLGTMNVVKAIALSCDTFFYRTAALVGDTNIARMAAAYGYGQAPQIEIPGAAAGVDPDSTWLADNCPTGGAACVWDPGQTLTMGIGQSYILTTPLIQAMYVSALADGGTLWKPTVVSQIVSPTGQVVEAAKPVVQDTIPISSQNLDVVRQGMQACLDQPYGTGYALRNMHFTFSGGCKTGTAQFGGSGYNLPTHAWFVLFSPYQNSQIAIAVLIENGGAGDAVAAPVAGEVADYFFAHQAQILAPSPR